MAHLNKRKFLASVHRASRGGEGKGRLEAQMFTEWVFTVAFLHFQE